MKGTTTTALAAIAVALAFTQGFAQQKGTFTDPRDKKTYKTVKIGEQTWYAQNANYAAYGSVCYGEGLEVQKSDGDWKTLSAKEFNANCSKYGRLYDYNSAFALACPAGWRLPTEEDWDMLITAAGGADSAGKALKAKAGWDSKGNGSDKLGFAGLPGGGLWQEGGYVEGIYAFYDAGSAGLWFRAGNNRGRYGIYAGGSGIGIGNNIDNSGFLNAKLSVRCVKGEPPAEAKEMAVQLEAQAKAEAEAEAEAKAKAKAEADSIAAVAKAEKERETRIKANSGAFTDSRDKKAYKTIKIGAQTWMSENLNYDAKGSTCYGSLPDYCAKYGRLYDWKNAMRACPAGWHLPTKDEWETLYKTAGGDNVAGAALKARETALNSRDGWKYNYENRGDDKFGFAALPGGGVISGYFKNAMEYGNWWSATENSAKEGNAHFARMTYSSPNLGRIDDPKTNKFSVRCVKGEAGKEAKAAIAKIEADEKAAAKPAAQQPKQQSGGQEFCSIAMLKTCVAVPKGTCAMTGGKVVSKCP